MLTTRESINHLMALSVEAGEVSTQAIDTARAAMRVAVNAQAMQAKLIEMLASHANLVDGHASVNHVRRALGEAPLAQENGTAVTVGPEAPGTAGVGKGSTEYSGPAQGGDAVAPHQVEQVLTDAPAEDAASNGKSAGALQSDLIDEIMDRKTAVRTKVIDLYHETECSIAVIATLVQCATDHVNTWINNARNANDARVLRGDDARGVMIDVEA